ncbi:putative quinol monooxygenase [Pseudoduganella aquatica]|jgi:quinol monooxygenase YgiN|uniref:Antibiotic biosynthesis monooxygenase n=1 Tax=Pseudoduganella aquatica TaxID=2660641 RepID=A0A7X4HH22_9BURK|nr:antibiotic biosynthesis monooxygenase [Pseudoduganella aquatica]MYN10010.1 antibiotic biosynthesis monooxygenase [Pseudoduganella aquatica]
MSDHIAFVVRLSSKPEVRERFRTELFNVVNRMKDEPDFINTWVHEDANDPNTFVLYETWACTREYFLATHLAKDYRVQYEALLPEMLAKERSIDFLNIIAAYPGRSAS